MKGNEYTNPGERKVFMGTSQSKMGTNIARYLP